MSVFCKSAILTEGTLGTNPATACGWWWAGIPPLPSAHARHERSSSPSFSWHCIFKDVKTQPLPQGAHRVGGEEEGKKSRGTAG